MSLVYQRSVRPGRRWQRLVQAYLATILVKAPMADRAGFLDLFDRVVGPERRDLSVWPFVVTLGWLFRLPFAAGFLDFFARPFIWTAMIAAAGAAE